MGTCFHKNTKEGGSRKVLKITPQKHSKWIQTGGGLFFWLVVSSEPCSDPLWCWNAPGPPFFTILASLFPHFCVAARYQEQLFLPSPPPQSWGGDNQKTFNTRWRALRQHFLSAARSETLSSGLSLSPLQLRGGNSTLFVALSGCCFRQSTWRW